MVLSPLMVEKIVSAGVDWLTVTCDEEKNGRRLSALADDLLTIEARRGFEEKALSLEGYHGKRCGGVQAGVRADGVMLRLSSRMASEHWRDALPLASNVTRLDTQLTLKLNVEVDTVLASMHRSALRHVNKYYPNREVDWRSSRLKGNTLYLGSRKSESFLRVYNKQRESREARYDHCLRVEKQFNKRAAGQIASTLFDDPSHESRVARALASEVERRALGSCGLRGDTLLSEHNDRAGDYLSKLDYLRKYQRKSFAFLCESGLLFQALVDLGIDSESAHSMSQIYYHNHKPT